MSEKREYNTMMLFKHFISFLEMWKQENYGDSAEINWSAVWHFVNAHSILDFNDELDEVVSCDCESEEFEEKVHSWMENRILNGEPIYLLFNMSDWLFDKLEKEHKEILLQKEIARFNNAKCYKCKYWKDHVSVWVQEYGQLNTYHLGDNVSDKVWECNPIHHFTECAKRNALVHELALKLLKERNISESHIHWVDDEVNEMLTYEKFQDETRTHQFHPNAQELTDCPYFEDTGITYDEYIKTYKELS